jgi:hypothetical protein
MRFSLCCFLLLFCSNAYTSAAEPARETPITDADREHWAYQPLKKPAVPKGKDETGWARTPIDAFILEKLERKQISPQREANRATLLRRVSFDLIGLPPTPDEVAAFAKDASPDAFERAVERLLASPHYGERWGQHWLDLARFAETDGFEHDRTRPEAWKYRDWVIRALNRDLGYDEFISLQLAGDELRPGDTDAAIATMFCLAGPDMPDINDQSLRRHNLLNEMTGTVGSALMAMQFGCAQCHDHKYDPISQGDFFRLRAFFDPAVTVKKDQLVRGMFEKTTKPEPSVFYVRGDVTRPGDELAPAFPRVINASEKKVPAPPDGAKTTQRRAALAKWLTDHEHPLTARVIVNRLWQHHFGRGLSTTPSDFGIVGEEPSHAALLDWLAVELIEHDWSLKHVQRLIVTSAVYRQGVRGSEFGVQDGAEKSSELNPEPRIPNPPPDLFASFPRQRLTAEAVRDAMLAVSGQLNARAGGPGVMPPLAKEVEITLLGGQWQVSPEPEDHVRRSVYIFARRNLRYPLLEAFDKADPNQTCAARHVSTTAPQALVMLNSRFSLDTARRLAGKAWQETTDLDRVVERIYLYSLSRLPSDKEQSLARDFLAKQAALLVAEKRAADGLALPDPQAAGVSAQQAAALVDFCLAILNTSEFVYVE